ncbi:MAG: sulfite exporter TauE/SafE family protein [Deltaproteobacteria bacterium]|nr:sulfite exporter TauE/SafE family protein [Deltaproteobacteria bacterium]
MLNAAALDAATIALLGVAAFFTAILSAVVGMAGGMTLLAIMLVFLPPLAAIPLHGAIQLASNFSRTVIQREHARYDLLWRYGWPLLPMGALGLLLANEIPERALEAVIGAFVLVATWRPGWLALGAKLGTDTNARFTALGFAAGFLNVTIGATGPLVAPFFLNLGLSRQAVIGTQAGVQALGHVAKLVLYAGFGFAFREHFALLALCGTCAIAGTWVGSRLLDRISERAFTRLYKSVLTLLAAQLVIGAAWSYFGAASGRD